jgi:hypothetical protein
MQAGAGAQQAAQAGAGAQQAAQAGAGAQQPGADGYVSWTCTVCARLIRVSANKPDYFKRKHLNSKGCVAPKALKAPKGAPEAGAAVSAAPKPVSAAPKQPEPYFGVKAEAAEDEAARAEEEAAAGPDLDGDEDLGQLDGLLDGASGDAELAQHHAPGDGGAAPPPLPRLRLVLPNGKFMHIVSATTEIFYPASGAGNTKGNPVNDRLARVAGKFDGLGSTTLGPSVQADSLLTIGDLIVTLACPKGNALPHLLVLLVQRIDVGTSRVFSLEEGVDANVHGVVRVLRPQPPPSTSWQVRGPGFIGKIASFVCSARLMMPLNTDVAFGHDGVAVHSVAEPDLKLAVEVLAGRFAAGSATVQSLSVPSAVWPYVGVDGGFPFVSLHNAEATAAQMEREAKEKWTHCQVCHKWGLRTAARLHIGAHALEQAAAACSLATEPRQAPNICGSCGVTPPCAISLQQVGKRKASQITSMCTYPLPSINYAAALKIPLLDPTANIPINCPDCGVTIWRRNAQHHFTEAHAGKPVPKELNLGAGDKTALFAAVAAATEKAAKNKAGQWRSGSGPTFARAELGPVVGMHGAGRSRQDVVLRGWSHLDEGKRVWLKCAGDMDGGRTVEPVHEVINLTQLKAWEADRERDSRIAAGEKSPSIAPALFPSRLEDAWKGEATMQLNEWWREVALTQRARRGAAREQLGSKGSGPELVAAAARVARVRALVQGAAAARIAPRPPRVPVAAAAVAGGKRPRDKGAEKEGEAEAEKEAEEDAEEEAEEEGGEEGEEEDEVIVMEAGAGADTGAAAAAAADAAARSRVAVAHAAMLMKTHPRTAGCCAHMCDSSCADDESCCPHWG